MPRFEGRRAETECSHPHGFYLPGDDLRWVKVTTDHHKVYLLRVKPGNTSRTRILIGEVRRHTPGLSYRGAQQHVTRQWRAFPEGGPVEYPEAFETHVRALAYLKNRWESGPVIPEQVRPQRKRYRSQAKPAAQSDGPPAWMKVLGDPWGDLDAGS